MLWPPAPPQTEDTLHPDHLNGQRDPTMKKNIQITQEYQKNNKIKSWLHSANETNQKSLKYSAK